MPPVASAIEQKPYKPPVTVLAGPAKHADVYHPPPKRSASSQRETGKKEKEVLAAAKVVQEYSDPEVMLASAASGNVALFEAVRRADPLLTRGFDQVRDYSGRTALHIAAWSGQVGVLNALLRPIVSEGGRGSVRAPNLHYDTLVSRNGNTVLHSAAMGGSLEVVQFLALQRGVEAIIMQVNMRGLTAAQCAVEMGHASIAEHLAAFRPTLLHPQTR